VISLGTTTIVFHRDVVQFSRRRMLAAGPFRERLEEEIERTKRHQRPVSLLAIAVGETTSEVRTRLGEAATAQLRLLDAVCWDGERHLLLLFPEVTREQAPVPSERILRALRQVHPELRAGFAVCPEDGCTPADLIDSACAAARGARTGELCSASATTASVKIGALRVVSVAPATVGVFKLAERLAATELPVLVSGETGVGKDLVAAALHAWSRRKDGPLVAINCAALPESLAESELFGYERGAFTGADAAKRGLFESAAGGVVFLDEVGELPLTVQAKLLRVLETRRALRIGGLKEIPLDVRIVSATNRSLQEEVTAGRFRGDLYYRLSAATIAVPALRERLEDVPLLARMFLEESCTQAGRALLQLSPEVNALLSNHDWPGNVRELKNAIERAMILEDDDMLRPVYLPFSVGSPLSSLTAFEVSSGGNVAASGMPGSAPHSEIQVVNGKNLPRLSIPDGGTSLEEIERTFVEMAMHQANRNQTQAAKLLDISRDALRYKLKKFGLMHSDDEEVSAAPH